MNGEPRQHIILGMHEPAVIHEDKPKINVLNKSLQLVLPVGCLVLALLAFVLRADDPLLGVFLLALTALVVLAFWLSTPRKYIITEDRIRVVFGFGYKKEIRFEEIEAVCSASKFGIVSRLVAWGYDRNAGIYPLNNVIAVKERKGRYERSFVYVSPQYKEEFYERLADQIKAVGADVKLLGL